MEKGTFAVKISPPELPSARRSVSVPPTWPPWTWSKPRAVASWLCCTQLSLAAVSRALSRLTQTLLVVAGFMVVGVALPAVVPIAFSGAGGLAPDHAGVAVSVVTTLGHGGFFMGPVLIGVLTEAFGLRLALGTVMITGVLVVAISPLLGARLEKPSD